MLQVLASAWALLFGMGLLMIGNGMQGTLLGIRGEIEGGDPPDPSFVDDQRPSVVDDDRSVGEFQSVRNGADRTIGVHPMQLGRPRFGPAVQIIAEIADV